MDSFKKAGIALIMVSASTCLWAGELPDTENMQGLQFNFSTPGARSLGMGGAFLGRADDATAAFANPAGLTNLFSSEVSAEFRKTDYTTAFSQSGSFAGGINKGESDSNVKNLSYLSYVYPLENWVFAAYVHKLMDFKTDFKAESLDLGNNNLSLPTDNRISTDILTYGLSAAYRVSDRISVGASLVFYDYSQNAFTRRLSPDASNELINAQLQSGSDTAWGVTLGASFALTERLNVGLVYRFTPEFDTLYQLQTPKGSAGTLSTDDQKKYKFEIPDVYGAGLSFQASENLTLNLDVIRVDYSTLTSPVFDAFASFNLFPAAGQKLGIDSGTEFHFGGEYVLANQPIAIRAGVWTDPAHTIEYGGSVDTNNIVEKFYNSVFKGSSDETHLAVGLGYFFGNKGQIDIAADFSDPQDTISVSAVFRFD